MKKRYGIFGLLFSTALFAVSVLLASGFLPALAITISAALGVGFGGLVIAGGVVAAFSAVSVAFFTSKLVKGREVEEKMSPPPMLPLDPEDLKRKQQGLLGPNFRPQRQEGSVVDTSSPVISQETPPSSQPEQETSAEAQQGVHKRSKSCGDTLSSNNLSNYNGPPLLPPQDGLEQWEKLPGGRSKPGADTKHTRYKSAPPTISHSKDAVNLVSSERQGGKER
jgi:hypothetical protein